MAENTDYIKREYAEKAMLDNCDIEFLEEYRIDRQKEDFCEIQPYYDAVLNYQQSLSIVPSADVVERKRGKWIAIQVGDYWNYGTLACSECKIAGFTTDTPFCPNCGADMRGGE